MQRTSSLLKPEIEKVKVELPAVVKKRQKDISGIEEQVIAMYAKGMTTTQISEMVESL